MIKDKVAPPKCLFHVATHIEIYSNRAISTFNFVKNWHYFSNTTELYN